MQTRLNSPADLGAAIRKERNRQKLRQADLAAIVESSHVFLRDVEQGKAGVQLGRVMRLLDELGLRLYLDSADAAPAPEVSE